MRSLSLLVLLLFAVVLRASATSAPSISTLMKELVANGAPQRFRTCKDFYLTEERPKLRGGAFFGLEYHLGFWALFRQELSQGWTVEQINDREVAIKSSLGYYISHGGGNYAIDAKDANEWEILTPWKNRDGSWSFKSRAAGWLSPETYHTSYVRHFIMFYPGNSRCEHWWLEPYIPPAKSPLMAELLADGGRRRFKAHNGLYLTYREKPWFQRNELIVTRGTGEDEQKWTIQQLNENEVTIRGPRVDYYVSHSDYDKGRPAYEVDTWEMLTPVKNDDGSWSFKSRWDKWLSGAFIRLAMRSLPLLVLLLFVVVVCSAESPSAQSPIANQTLMEELLANGGYRRFKSFNELYLTDDQTFGVVGLYAVSRHFNGQYQDWTIVQMNDNEVAIRSNRGYYIKHGATTFDDGFVDYARLAQVAKAWEMLTPVKNADGTWSFKSRWNKWLSAHKLRMYQRYDITFESDNNKCERWVLEPYTPPVNPLMEELLANGGRRRFKSLNGLYLTDDHPDQNVWTLRRQFWGSNQDWTIVQISFNEVAIKSNRGHYIGHGSGGWAKQAEFADSWEIFTPVKNGNGSWSFKSRWNKWMSGHYYYEPHCYAVNFQPENKACERWILEVY